MKDKKKQNLFLRVAALLIAFIIFLIAVYNIYRVKLDNLYKDAVVEHIDVSVDFYTAEIEQNLGNVGQFDGDQMDKLFEDFPFGNEAWIALVNEEGKVLYHFCERRSGYVQPGINIYNELSALSEESATQMMGKIEKGASGIAYITTGNITGSLFYKPVEKQPWYVIMGIPDSYLDAQLAEKDRLYAGMMISQFVGMFLFAALFVYIIVMDRIHGKAKREKLTKLAETDQLTGLYNKVTTEKKIKEFMEENPDMQSMLFVLDIDNFKKINDTMGHAFGDEVLRTIGQRIKMEFRASDIIGRAGGDEFIIFLKNLREEEYIIKEAQKVENFFKDFKVGDYTKYAATASIGCAVFPREGADFETLYKAADQALYQAKQRGKNQLAFYKEPEGFGQSV